VTAEIIRADAAFMRDHFDGFCELLRDVVDGGASVNFVAPLDAVIARAYWEKVAAEVVSGQRIVLAAMADDRVVGCAHLVPATTPNGHHRAEVQKVLVHSAYRRQGIAQALMAIEDEARAIGRWLLVLDTEEGSGAQAFYERLGYLSAGGIPEFALSADAASYRANVYYYKKLI
jgi:GNAT superfamily N-acetyltransferase